MTRAEQVIAAVTLELGRLLAQVETTGLRSLTVRVFFSAGGGHPREVQVIPELARAIPAPDGAPRRDEHPDMRG